MLRMVSDEEQKENLKRLKTFTKNNHCEMYNYMLNIEGFVSKGKSDELYRIVNVVSKLKLTDEIKKKVIDAIKEKSKQELEERMKKYHGEVKK